MPVPSPRNSIRIARGNFADLNANSTAFGEGEFIYAIDQDRFYTASSGVLVAVGAGVVAAEGIDTLADVDTSTIAPGVGQVLKWDGTNWVPADDSNTDAVTSVAGKTGDVTLVKADITDFSDGDYATAAQGTLADSATQPGDNISTLTNDAAYITSAGAPVQSVAGKTGAVTLVKADITDFSDSDYATAAQGVLADSATQPGDNISTLTNDSAFVDAAGASAAAPVQSVAGKTGAVTLVKGDVGLDQVDNTSDINKPISTATQSALDLKADLVGGVVPNSQLPSLAITEYLGTVASEAALLALTGQRGDWAIRTDTGSTWVITTDGGSTITDWTELATPADAVSSVNGFTGTVVLGASDVGAATTAQGALADSATQPGDNISTLTNDAAYITSAGAPVQSVAGKTGAVTLVKADITDFSDADYATAAQGSLADGAVQSAGDTMTGALGMPAGSAASPSVYFDATSGLYSPGADQVAISTNGTGRLFVDASGNVGVGSGVSAIGGNYGTLSIRGKTNDFGGGIIFESLDGTDRTFAYGDVGAFYLITQDTRPLVLGTNATEKLRITSDGKLGLGTSSPTAPLTIAYSGAGAQLQINNSGNNRMVYLGAYSANEGILRLFNSSDVETVRIPAESTAGVHTFFNAGNVGIGTTSPATDVLLTVGGNDTNSGIMLDRSAGDNCAIHNVGGTLVFKNGSSSTVSGLTERARIDSSGRLLVGTTTSTNNPRLGVAGSTHIGAGDNTVSLADGATGTVITPARGYSYINVSHSNTASDGLLLLVFANTITLTIVSTVHSNAGTRYSVSASGRDLQVTNALGITASFYASCLTLAHGNNG